MNDQNSGVELEEFIKTFTRYQKLRLQKVDRRHRRREPRIEFYFPDEKEHLTLSTPVMILYILRDLELQNSIPLQDIERKYPMYFSTIRTVVETLEELAKRRVVGITGEIELPTTMEKVEKYGLSKGRYDLCRVVYTP